VYELLVEAHAERDLRRLEPEALRRVVDHIKSLAGNPRPPGSRKIVGSENDWRIRVGTYRVVYEIDDRARQVRIMCVRHRREAYR